MNDIIAVLMDETSDLMLDQVDAYLLKTKLMTEEERNQLLKRHYERRWESVVDRPGDFNETYKSLAIMKDDLSKVVGWFSLYFGCELGVVAESLVDVIDVV